MIGGHIVAIIGVSGSPILGGNTDRMIKALLEKSGKDTVFVNLSMLQFSPCRGCAHLCARTNTCGINDELTPYLNLVPKSEAIVLGTPYQLGTATGFMHDFLTRLWCFYHVKNLLADKPVVLISVGIKQKEKQNGIASFESMVTHSDQFKVLGHIYFNSQTPPCLKCGAGSYCHVGGLWKYVLNKDKKKLREFKFTPDKFKKWDDYPEIVEEINKYGIMLAEL